jgi:GH25 family lysozyme M1 (1,4-beta-N-acetylmuramidase)
MKTFADISHHQGAVDMSAYARAGHDRIVMKATEGIGFTDSRFAANWKAAGDLGLARVVYSYAQAEDNGAADFDHLLDVVNKAGGLGPRDIFCIDVEDVDDPGDMARAQFHVREFTNRAAARGFAEGLLYTGRWYANPAHVDPSDCAPGWRKLWISHYDQSVPDDQILLPTGWTRDQVVARQFTASATVAGVTGPCDLSRLFRDWIINPSPKEDPMADYSLADDVRGKEWVKEAIHDQVQAGIQEVLKGGSNGAFDGLPAPEKTALTQTEERLGAKIDALKPGV